jgi:hypothetical protein
MDNVPKGDKITLNMKANPKIIKILPILVFIVTFLIYKFIYPNPRNWYDHYLFLAKAFLAGRVNLTDLPSFYQDVITIGNKVFVPFPPGPALALIPFIIAKANVTEQQVSIILGSLDVALFSILFLKFTNLKNTILLCLFLSFGSALFWASVVGTSWYFAHVVAFMFLTISLIFHFEKKDILSGVFFSLAVLSRYPVLLAAIFFALQLRNDRQRFLKFFVSAASLAPIHFLYSYLRFGSFFKTGYVEVYESYVKMHYPYTILQAINPSIPLFGYLDPRNIPLHIFTFLVEPPIITNSLNISPAQYGTGIIFTSPLLFLSFKFPFKDKLEKHLIIAACFIAFLDFLHYMQGWVQFGYRFVLDFLPFLLILLAIKFKLNKLTALLLVISILVTLWGVNYAIMAGW